MDVEGMGKKVLMPEGKLRPNSEELASPLPKTCPLLIFNTPPSFFWVFGLCWGSPHLRDSDG